MSDSSSAPFTAAPKPVDPPRPLPFRAVLVVSFLVLGLEAAFAYGLARPFGWDAATSAGITVGGATSVIMCVIAFLAILPWKSRPAADWTLWWIGATTLRLLLTPVALFSVYFATLLPGPAVLLGGAAAYVVALFSETAVIARAVLRSGLGSPSAPVAGRDIDSGTG